MGFTNVKITEKLLDQSVLQMDGILMKEQKYFSPFPDEFNFSLIHHAYALCSQINSTGTLLASGHTTGLVIIWDFVFRKTVHTINHHVYPIADVAWSKSKKL